MRLRKPAKLSAFPAQLLRAMKEAMLSMDVDAYNKAANTLELHIIMLQETSRRAYATRAKARKRSNFIAAEGTDK